MEIKVNIKHMGKRKNSVEPKIYRLPAQPSTVRELILAVVEAGVLEYNERMENQESGELLKCLTRQEIEDKAGMGKVSFGAIYGEKKADLKQAQDNAVQCFEDGIYRIFFNEKPLEKLEQKLDGGLNEGIFTFVRLTMLSGRSW